MKRLLLAFLIICTGVCTPLISKAAVPVAAFSGTPVSGCAPVVVHFTDLSTGTPTSWAWSITGPATFTSTLQSPNFTFTVAGTYTVNVKSYFPNDFGLYNMAGNVAEWTSSAFDESASTFVSDLAPTFEREAKANDPEVLKRKVVKGGSWKDVGYFLQNSTRTYEYQDTAKSYIGFRCVTSFLGRDIKDKR